MNVSAINCTSIRPQQASFKSKHSEDYGKDNPLDKFKAFATVAIVTAGGALAAKGLSGKLLNKITKDEKFAAGVGKKIVELYNRLNLETKIESLNLKNKNLETKIKNVTTAVIKFVKDFAKKGVDENATAESKAVNGVKKLLSYIAGGVAGVEAAQKGKDGIPDGINLADAVVNAAEKTILSA